MGLFRPYQPKTEAERSQAEAKKATTAVTTDAAPAATPAPKAAKSVTAKAKAKAAVAVASAPSPASPASAASPAEPVTAASGKTQIARPTPGKKSVPTPTRKQALAARQERLNPVLTKKDAKKRDREARMKQQNDAIRKRDEQPVMTMIRDYVDCRWSLGEFLLPIVLIIILVPMLLSAWPKASFAGAVACFALYLGMIVDAATMWFGLRKRIRQFFPNETLRGKLSYGASRMMMLRRWRKPAPVVKRGTKFTWPRAAELR
ncbi:MAG: DUF3043 domain-containing protein [Propionibacteriaceae bacterium]|nr:DUF3043 domain-containing protein [Propionibacteriaceae bacterium]